MNITETAMIERQHRMMGLGMTVDLIRKLISLSDDQLAEVIAKGEANLDRLEGERRQQAENILNAMKIERDIRAC